MESLVISLVVGNPFQKDTMDDGFRSAIFTHDTNIEKYTQNSCSLKFSSHVISSLRDYRDALSTFMSFQGSSDHGNDPSIQYQTVLSSHFKWVYDSLIHKNEHLIISIANCAVRSENIIRSSPPELTENFQNAISALPHKSFQNVYNEFLKEYGTHIVTKVTLGASYIIVRIFNEEEFNSLTNENINIEYAASLSAKNRFFKNDDDDEVEEEEDVKSVDIVEIFEGYKNEERVIVVGIEPPTLRYDEHVNWLSKILSSDLDDILMPIWYELSPMTKYEIFDKKGSWKKLFPIEEVVHFIEEAQAKYILEVPQKMLHDSIPWYERLDRCPDTWEFVDYLYSKSNKIKGISCKSSGMNVGICEREMVVHHDTNKCHVSRDCMINWMSAGCSKVDETHWALTGYECPLGWTNWHYHVDKNMLTCRVMSNFNRGDEKCPSVLNIAKHFDRCGYAKACGLEWKNCYKYGAFLDSESGNTENLNNGLRLNKTKVFSDLSTEKGAWKADHSRKCANHYFMRGFIKGKYNKTSAGWVSDLRNIKKGYCQTFPSSSVRMECHLEDWEGKLGPDELDSMVSCNKGFALRGLKRSDCFEPECIKKVHCCKSVSAPREYIACSEVDISKKIELSKVTHIKCPDGYFLTGFLRECDSDAGSLDVLSCLTKMKCCMLSEF